MFPQAAHGGFLQPPDPYIYIRHTHLAFNVSSAVKVLFTGPLRRRLTDPISVLRRICLKAPRSTYIHVHTNHFFLLLNRLRDFASVRRSIIYNDHAISPLGNQTRNIKHLPPPGELERFVILKVQHKLTNLFIIHFCMKIY